MLLVTGCSQTIVPDRSNVIMAATPTLEFAASTGVDLIATTLPFIEQEIPVMNESPISTPLSSGLERFVLKAKEDLANRLYIDIGQIELVEFKAMVWPDSSMGCPQPGMEYTQVQREGYLIRLRHGSELFNYHGGKNRLPFLCEKTAGDDVIPSHPDSGDY